MKKSQLNTHYILPVGMVLLILVSLYLAASAEFRSRNIEQELHVLKSSLADSKPDNFPSKTTPPPSEPTQNIPEGTFEEISFLVPIFGDIVRVDAENNIIHIQPEFSIYQNVPSREIIEVIVSTDTEVTMAVGKKSYDLLQREWEEYEAKYGEIIDQTPEESLNLEEYARHSPFIEEIISLDQLRVGQLVNVFPRSVIPAGASSFEAFRLTVFAVDFQ